MMESPKDRVMCPNCKTFVQIKHYKAVINERDKVDGLHDFNGYYGILYEWDECPKCKGRYNCVYMNDKGEIGEKICRYNWEDKQ